ncbi:MAG TPA: transketolase [Blastocatellia bacterium]|jgi:transketolase|nr:transketolase [Blastocatellia bacterium]
MKATEQSDVRIDELCINTIRTLAMDAVEQAKSGHPGTPMALAPVAYVLWDRFLRYNPQNPLWPNRDRFVLSNGHASMLLYSLLHLFGYDLPIEELKRFRQWDSKTPGHPEYGLTPGVETTTGPLGQGVANSVGMAMAREWLAARFNQSERPIVDYRVYAICGDGDLMEGISQEAASLAGHLALSNLTWIYDNNHITIEGSTSLAFSDDVAARFTSYRWNVLHVADANDLDSIDAAIRAAHAETERPTLIILDSHIAWGAPHKQDTAAAHGEPLGEEEIRLAKRKYGWPEDAKFLVPEEALEHARKAVGRGAEAEKQWQARLEEYLRANPERGREWELMQSGGLPEAWDAAIPSFPADETGIASRDASSKVLNAIAPGVPWLIGGSADLAPSTKTLIKDGGDFEAGAYGSRNLHFGIREHAMGAILNGMALSRLRPYGATFLIFSDYMKGAVRLSALMEQRAIFIFTHDSIGVGEDGPTHQPIEQLMALRSIPGLFTFRPADANEVAESWRCIMGLPDHPAALVLTRQALPTVDRSRYARADGVSRGAYTLADSGGVPDVILMATGSEVQLCVAAYEQLKSSGVKARVVSMPCWELFERQPREYRDEILPPRVRARLAVEAGTSLGWSEYAGLDGRIIARRQFGASAPFKELLKQFGFTVENIVTQAREMVGREA